MVLPEPVSSRSFPAEPSLFSAEFARIDDVQPGGSGSRFGNIVRQLFQRRPSPRWRSSCALKVVMDLNIQPERFGMVSCHDNLFVVDGFRRAGLEAALRLTFPCLRSPVG